MCNADDAYCFTCLELVYPGKPCPTCGADVSYLFSDTHEVSWNYVDGELVETEEWK